MQQRLRAELARHLTGAGRSLPDAAALLREAFDVDRVSIARLEDGGRRFQIVAEAGAELLSPGTALPSATCSYFRLTAENQPFLDNDFERSSSFNLPLDGVILATGFRCGCSVPIRRGPRTIGALSLSCKAPRRMTPAMLGELEPCAGALAAELWCAPGSRRVLICHQDREVGSRLAAAVEREAGAQASLTATVAEAIADALSSPPGVVVAGDWLDGLGAAELTRALDNAGVRAPVVVVPREPERSIRHTEQPGLTQRELQLVRLLDEGLRFKQIARRLQISESTAKTHGRRLFRKLHATSRAEAVHAARRQGLLA